MFLNVCVCVCVYVCLFERVKFNRGEHGSKLKPEFTEFLVGTGLDFSTATKSFNIKLTVFRICLLS